MLNTSQWAVSQRTAVINTKRDFPIGIVSFGASVLTGVMGGENFVDGYIKKSGNDTFVFPVGDDGALRPFAAQGNETTGAYFGVDPTIAVTSNPMGGNFGVLPLGGPFNAASINQDVKKVSTKEYWDINGGSPTRITLSWNSNSNISAITDGKGLKQLTIVGWNGSKWVKIASKYDQNSILGGASDLTSGSITTDAAFIPDAYQVYTLGAATDGALPVTLVSFNALIIEKSVSLDWVTSSEVNSSHFEVERSADAKSWFTFGTVISKSFADDSSSSQLQYAFMDETPLAGTSYYRLKMVDKDETFAYSKIRTVTFSGENVVVYPNPVSGRLFMRGFDEQNLLEARLLNVSGQSVICPGSTFREGFDVSKMPSGAYILNLTLTTGQSRSFKVLVKN
ncbi:T9SS type A sorting domain-containing protein [Dyadobacter luticola]|uniref:T9SS type A sorting domain-containing protein n=1 Tax=Dyadobacter luticola TaxID=1979387 RepID=UPI001486B6E7|nr:T9SS type A sorting domain-containing protein [Dyadobacter luticola]